MITASEFRDGVLTAFRVGYDWDRSGHFAEITVRGKGPKDKTFRITGLTSWSASEDFSAQYIVAQCANG